MPNATAVKINPTYRLEEFIIPTVVAFAIISSIILVIYSMSKTNANNTTANNTATPSTAATAGSPTPTLNLTDSFEMKVLKQGTGTGAKSGQKVTVNYTGTFKTTGKKFDSSLDSGRTPFSFTLGAGEVIKGWDQGVLGMKVGEERQLQVPPALGYGPNDYGPIPGNSTLMFDVTLLKIE